MAQEAYVSFEIALLLKEKGFEQFGCNKQYNTQGDLCSGYCYGPVAPTQQMAMAWLRTKHIIITVQPEYFSADGTCSYWGVDIWADDNYEKLQGDYPKYEEAVEAALKYALEDLI